MKHQQVADLITDALDAAAVVKEKQDADRRFFAAIRADMFRKRMPVIEDQITPMLAGLAAIGDLLDD